MCWSLNNRLWTLRTWAVWCWSYWVFIAVYLNACLWMLFLNLWRNDNNRLPHCDFAPLESLNLVLVFSRSSLCRLLLFLCSSKIRLLNEIKAFCITSARSRLQCLAIFQETLIFLYILINCDMRVGCMLCENLIFSDEHAWMSLVMWLCQSV